MQTEMDRYWELTAEEWREVGTGTLLDLLVRVPSTSDLHATVTSELARRIDGDEVTGPAEKVTELELDVVVPEDGKVVVTAVPGARLVIRQVGLPPGAPPPELVGWPTLWAATETDIRSTT